MSSVIRVIKNRNYTTLSNYHFKDRRLSWKAKGLLSTMLSLPDDWNYTIEGLSKLSGDGIRATNSGLLELERYGYLARKQLRNENGSFGPTEYTIYEEPQQPERSEKSISAMEQEKQDSDYYSHPESQNAQTAEQEVLTPLCQNVHTDGKTDCPPICQNAQTGANTAFLPLCRNARTENPITGNSMQLNTNILNTKELNTYSSSSSSPESESSDDVQNRMRQKLPGDEIFMNVKDEENRIRERLMLEKIKEKCSSGLVEAVFKELCRRDRKFIRLMDAGAMEQVCLAVEKKQHEEPIRMLPNLINTYLDNIMVGIRAAASGSGGGMQPPQRLQHNRFNDFKQNEYDFALLEKELLAGR